MKNVQKRKKKQLKSAKKDIKFLIIKVFISKKLKT